MCLKIKDVSIKVLNLCLMLSLIVSFFSSLGLIVFTQESKLKLILLSTMNETCILFFTGSSYFFDQFGMNFITNKTEKSEIKCKIFSLIIIYVYLLIGISGRLILLFKFINNLSWIIFVSLFSMVHLLCSLIRIRFHFNILNEYLNLPLYDSVNQIVI